MPISENGVSFFGSGGHSHNGVNSTIIDVGSYSLFDFSLGYTGSQSRINRQSVNQNAMEDWIVRTINSKVLQPAGLNLSPNTLSGKAIRANTITADQISANTITANELVSNIVLVNNSIQSSVYSSGSEGWRISNTGVAEFNNVTVRGAVVANSGTVGGIVISGSSISSTNFNTANNAGFAIYSNGFADFNNVSVRGEILATSGQFSGTITANGTISGGTISGATVTGGTVTAGTLDGGANTVGLELEGGYIRHGGGGVRVKNFGGGTGLTKLFADQIFTRDYFGESYNIVGSFTAKTTGVEIETTGNRPLILKRNYVDTSHFITFVRTTPTTANVGSVEFNGDSAVRYNTTSDERLKENLNEIKNSIITIKNIIPYSYNYKESPEYENHGFIAQQVYSHYPYPVSVGGDDPHQEPWMIDYSGFSPLIVAALKEIIGKVENIEARLQALEDV